MPHIVLATKHQKSRWIAPYLEPLGYQVRESDAFDTDSLGTFSGEIARTCSPEQAALTKAKQACEYSNAAFGLGSEGSFGGGPYFGLVNFNTELLCLYQRDTNTAIYGHAAGPFSPISLPIEHHTTAQTIAEKLAKFEQQHWILTLPHTLEKGLSLDELLARFTYHLPSSGKIIPDLRAMHSPERQTMIANAAKDLARRLTSFCPQCKAANFVIKKAIAGLICSQCSLPTKQVKHHLIACDHCQHSCVVPSNNALADPTYCQICNP